MEPDPQEPLCTAVLESLLELWAPLYVGGLPGIVFQFPSALQWAEQYYDSFPVHLRRARADCVCGRKLLADLWSSLPLLHGVTGWCERHRQSRALEWAAVSVWKGFITSYGEHKAGIPWKQNCGFWDGTNKIGLFFHCSGERWSSEKPVLPPPPLPRSLGKAAGSNQKEAPGIGADAGAGSSGAAGHADAFLHLDQTFFSAY